MSVELARTAWNNVRGDEPDFARLHSDFKTKLIDAATEAKRDGVRSGIAGCEAFDDEVQSLLANKEVVEERPAPKKPTKPKRK